MSGKYINARLIGRSVLIILLLVLLVIVFWNDGLFQKSSSVDVIDRIAESGIAPWNFDANDPLLAQRKILIAAEINERTSKEVIYKLLYLDTVEKKAIDVYLLTTGGWTDATFAIIDVICSISSPVNTLALGGCSSAGAMILACGTGTRYSYPNSVIMIHSNLEESQEQHSTEMIDKNRIERFWKTSAKLPDHWFPLTGDTEYYLSAQEAKEFDIIDEIMEKTPHNGARTSNS
ncbi:MAG: ATP-dependent Clp protease proteolytic subunit [Desulfobacteraceae bacterium]|nr:MAG: ATP-dependent Clp protease proteolytic subunit [Desulfobacteraceae bacterium]